MDGQLTKCEFLIKTVSTQIKDALTHYSTEHKIELIKHLTEFFREVQQYYQTKSHAFLQQFINREVALLEKYRSAYTPYEKQRFFDLFDTDKVLLSTGYYTPEEFNALPKEVTALKPQEVSEFCDAMDDLLSDLECKTYKEPTTEIKMEKEEESDTTEMQQLLAIHYLLKAGFKVQARGDNSVSQFTQLAHLLLGKKFTSLQNSSIYKKYKKLPNFENPNQLVKDLKHIKPYFEKLELKNVIDLIDKDLREAEGDKKGIK